MALVNFLRFNDDSGAIISDEEFWNVHFRKRMHGDVLHSLLTPEMANAWGIQVVYGGIGYPSIHKDVISDTREALQKIIETDSKPPSRVKEIARIAFENLQAAIRRRIDQKLTFFYGFTTDDLNRGYFMRETEKIPIQTEVIKENAKKLSAGNQKDQLLKFVMDSKAAVFGYDADGITGYHLSAENAILGYVHEGFECIGAGKYASGLVLGGDFKSKTLKMRKAGYAPDEGILELIDSAYIAGEHFKEVGGNYHFVIIDRKAAKTDLKYREIFDNRARLATEIVRAMRADLIDRESARKLLDDLIFKNKKMEDVEKLLFSKVKDKDLLMLILRKYKNLEAKNLCSGRSQI